LIGIGTLELAHEGLEEIDELRLFVRQQSAARQAAAWISVTVHSTTPSCPCTVIRVSDKLYPQAGETT
jgi:hypothetical protein